MHLIQKHSTMIWKLPKREKKQNAFSREILLNYTVLEKVMF